MGIYDNWTYTDLHQLNLDWLIKHVKEVENNLDSAKENAQRAEQSATNAQHSAELSETYANQSLEAVETLRNIKRRYIILGDSYGAGWTPEETYTGWPDRIKNLMNINDDDFFTNSIGGVGFCNTVNGVNWLTMLSGINATSPETITDIVVAGGYNDKNFTIEQITANITSFCGIANNLYPNAIIHIGMIGYTFETNATNIIKALAKVLTAYQRAPFINKNAVYMNNVENSLTNTSYLSASDKHHPNDLGLNFLAMNISQYLKTGYCDIYHSLYSDLTPASSVTTSGGIQTAVYNNVIHSFLQINEITGTFTYSGSSLDILVGTFNGPRCLNMYNDSLSQYVNVVIRRGTGTQFKETTACIYIMNNELHIKLKMLNDAGNGYYAGDIYSIQLGINIHFMSTTFQSF